jgi:arylsulfatase
MKLKNSKHYKAMNKKYLTAFLFAPLGLLAGTSPTLQAKRPNIVIILTDDMGYSDPGCFGGEIQTPNLDQLAATGIRFTQFYNCARCCPSRASLLTGQYPQKAGINGMGVNLNKNAATLAEILKANGYHTGMTGKWHLSLTKALDNKNEHLRWLAHQTDHGSFSPLENYPCNRGFEEHYGIIWGVINYFDPFSLVHNETPIKEVPEDFYMTDFITKKSIDLIDQFSKDKKPFFLYVAHTAPHWPLQARQEDIAKYRNKYLKGWEVLRKERYQRMVDLKLIDPATCQLLPNSSGKPWVDCQNKETEAACMTVHAAMVDRVDQGIGRIIQKLKDTGQYENTILFFMSDNGASYERGYQAGFDRPGFTRDSVMIEYNSKNPGAETTWNYLGNAWANAINTPFRFWKIESYEGGTCTPMIVNWPKGLKKQQNTINHGVGHVIDILPTCLNLAGASYPTEINGMKTELPDGKDLMPMILGQTNSVHDTLFWEHQGGKAIRVGDWKMSARKDSPWEIFNLAKDRNEAINLVGQFPDKEKELNAAWEKWAVKMKINIK